MSARAKPNRYCVSALERGIRILSLFEHYPTEISGAAVARELQLPRATAFRLLRTLELLGRLERAEGGAYRIGPTAPQRGAECRASLEVTQAARSAVDQLRDRTRCSTYLVVRDARDAVVALKAASVEPGINLSVGMRRPACSSILGRVLLCELTDAELTDLYPELELPHVGIGTPRSLAELKQLLYEDLARGYTIGDSVVDQGISGVAAPVRAPDGEFVAAVGLTVPNSALKQWALRDWLVHEVLAAAAEIAEGLSHRRRPGHGTAHREPRAVRAARERGDASVSA